MKTREPKCVQWKRRGAEKVATQISGLSLEQELQFWEEKTKQLKTLKVQAQKNQAENVGDVPQRAGR